MPGSHRRGCMNLHQVHASMHRHVDRARPQPEHPTAATFETRYHTGDAKSRRAKRRRNARH